MEEKKYDKDLGKYVITETFKKEDKNSIKTIIYKDIDIPVADNLKDYIIELNSKLIEIDNSISYLTEERRKLLTEQEYLKRIWNTLTSNIHVEYNTEEKTYTKYEDLVHKKALIQ